MRCRGNICSVFVVASVFMIISQYAIHVKYRLDLQIRKLHHELVRKDQELASLRLYLQQIDDEYSKNMHYTRDTSRKYAYITYCTDVNYEKGSRVVLFSAIRSTGSRIPGILLHTHQLSGPSWDGIPMVITRKVTPPQIKQNGYYRHVMTKLLMFVQYDYDRLVYVESDGIVMKSIEHLFDLPNGLYIPHCRWCSQLPLNGYRSSSAMRQASPATERFWRSGRIAQGPRRCQSRPS